MKRAGGRAGGAPRGGPGGRSPPGKALRYVNIDRTKPSDGTDHDGDRTDRTEHLPENGHNNKWPLGNCILWPEHARQHMAGSPSSRGHPT
eukprot:486737-Alexandrium_andersonii.AAC.1